MKTFLATSSGVFMAFLASLGVVPATASVTVLPAWADRLGWTLVHSAWQLAVVAIIAALVDLGLKRRSANARYVVGVAALLMMIALPCVTWMQLDIAPRVNNSDGPSDEANAVGWDQRRFDAPAHHKRDIAEDGGPAPEAGLSHPTVVPSLRRWDAGFGNDPKSDVPSAERRDYSSSERLVNDLNPEIAKPLPSEPQQSGSARFFEQVRTVVDPRLPLFVALWFVGVVLCSLRPVWGLWTQWRLRVVGLSSVPDELQRTLTDLARRMEVARLVRIAQSACVNGPMVVGYLKPVILLPASVLTGLTPTQLESLLAHELAHVRRHDWLVNALQVVVETLLFYHPAVWWLSSRIRHERELCCDDIALAVIGDKATYGRMLLALEVLRHAKPLQTVMTPATMAATGGSLVERIRRLMPVPREMERTQRGWLSGTVVLVALAVSCGVWFVTHATAENGDLARQDESVVKDEESTSEDSAVKKGTTEEPSEDRESSDSATGRRSDQTTVRGEAKFDPTADTLRHIAGQRVGAKDWPQWCGSNHRNNTPSGQNIPIKWDLETGENVLWKTQHGRGNLTTPVVANGKVFVGGNNLPELVKRYPKKVDLGCLRAYSAETGEFLWQATHEKLSLGNGKTDRGRDWPLIGICSPPTVEGTRLWYVSNRSEVVCLDTEGFRDGENDGPIVDETDRDPTDADFIWRTDLVKDFGVVPHYASASTVLCVGERCFVITSNGVGDDHQKVVNPEAPSFVCLDKNTGKVLWADNSPGSNILAGSWSSPCAFEVNGETQIVMAGGDGWLYSFTPEGDGQGHAKLLWKFDANPKESLFLVSQRSTRNSILATPVFYDGLVYVGVGENPEFGEGVGRLWCIDPTKRGDVSQELAVDANDQPLPPRRIQVVDRAKGERAIPNPNSAAVWCYTHDVAQMKNGKPRFEGTMHRTLGNVVIKNGLLVIADFGGLLHCVDAKQTADGQPVVYWTHDTFTSAWGTPLIVEDKVYIGDEDGNVRIFALSKTKQLIAEPSCISPIETTPIVANDTLFITALDSLIALRQKSPSSTAAESSRDSSTATKADATKLGVQPSWPSFRHDLAQTGVATSSLPDKLSLLWETTVGNQIVSTAAIIGDDVFVASLSGELVRLKRTTGKRVWSYKSVNKIEANEVAPGFKSSPTVTADTIYLGDDAGVFHAIDRTTGVRRWKFQTSGEIYSSAAVLDGKVLFGSYDQCLYCLNEKDGTAAWQKIETQGYVHAAPSVADGLAFVAGCDQHLRGIDIKTGEQKLSLPLGSYLSASPAISGGIVYVGTHGGEVLAVDRKNSTIAGRYKPGDGEFAFHSSPAVSDKRIVIGGRDKQVYALDRSNGQTAWKFATRAKVDSSPVIVGDRVFVGSDDGSLYEIGLTDGKERWKYSTGKPISASPAVGEGVLIIGIEGHDGRVLCFGASNSTAGKADPRVSGTGNGIIKVGMTQSQVIAIKGKHYREYVGQRLGQMIHVYDDIAVYYEGPMNDPKTTLIENPLNPTWKEALKDIPYADAATPAEKKTAPKDDSQSTRKRTVQVVDEQKRPIAGATVRFQFEDKDTIYVGINEKTDENGACSQVIPDGAKRVIITVMADGFGEFVEGQAVGGSSIVEMKPGRVIRVRAVDGEQKILKRAVPLLADHRVWGREFEPQKDGTFKSPSVALKRKLMRVAAAQDDGPMLFSELIDVTTAKPGEDGVLQLTHKPGTRIEGKLDDSVPRPITEGYVELCLVEAEDHTLGYDSWDWHDFTPVKPDGTFVFESVPGGGHAQIHVLVDGYISKKPTAHSLKEYMLEHKLADEKAIEKGLEDFKFRAMRGLFVTLDQPVVTITVACEKTASCDFLLLDPSGKPVPDVEVRFNPNGAFTFGRQFNPTGISYESLLVEELHKKQTATWTWNASLPHGREAMQQQDWMNRWIHRAKSDADGRVRVRNLPGRRRESFHVESEDYVLPVSPLLDEKDLAKRNPTDDRDRYAIADLSPGETVEKTIFLERKLPVVDREFSVIDSRGKPIENVSLSVAELQIGGKEWQTWSTQYFGELPKGSTDTAGRVVLRMPSQIDKKPVTQLRLGINYEFKDGLWISRQVVEVPLKPDDSVIALLPNPEAGRAGKAVYGKLEDLLAKSSPKEWLDVMIKGPNLAVLRKLLAASKIKHPDPVVLLDEGRRGSDDKGSKVRVVSTGDAEFAIVLARVRPMNGELADESDPDQLPECAFVFDIQGTFIAALGGNVGTTRSNDPEDVDVVCLGPEEGWFVRVTKFENNGKFEHQSDFYRIANPIVPSLRYFHYANSNGWSNGPEKITRWGTLEFDFPKLSDKFDSPGYSGDGGPAQTADGVPVIRQILWDGDRNRFVGAAAQFGKGKPLYEVDLNWSKEFEAVAPKSNQLFVTGGEREYDHWHSWHTVVPDKHEMLLTITIPQADSEPKVIEKRIASGKRHVQLQLKPNEENTSARLELRFDSEKPEVSELPIRLGDRPEKHPPITHLLNPGDSARLLERSLKSSTKALILEIKLRSVEPVETNGSSKD